MTYYFSEKEQLIAAATKGSFLSESNGRIIKPNLKAGLTLVKLSKQHQGVYRVYVHTTQLTKDGKIAEAKTFTNMKKVVVVGQ